MSWDGYITNLKTADQSGTIPIEEAAICGINPCQVWASSPGWTITEDEIKKLLLDPSSFHQCGPVIGGHQCRFLRQMGDKEFPIIDLKTKVDDAGNAFSICVAKTNQALVIGKGINGASGGQVNAKVVATAEYLKGLKY